jgi:flagellin-like hook-associated protein FlgL
MGSDVVLSAGVRQNLLALQDTARIMSITQNRLATGKKVNSAIDNPVNFFTGSGLSSRAKDLSALLDGMENGIKTIEAADNGITSIKATIESMKSTLLQARQDKSFKSITYSVGLTTPAATDVLTLSGGALSAPVNVDVTNTQAVRTSASNYANMDFSSAANTWDGQLNFTVAVNGGTARNVLVAVTSDTNLTVSIDGGPATNYAIADADIVTGADMVGALNAAFTANNVGVSVAGSTGAPLAFTSTAAFTNSQADVVVTTGAVTAPAVAASFYTNGALTKINPVAQTVDQIAAGINSNALLTDKVTASNDGGRLRITNLSTIDLSLLGATNGGVITGDLGAANTTSIGGNVVRRNLVKQYNDLRDQLNKFADDASFNGVNLLRGDKLRISFNELGTSTIVVQAQDEFGVPRPINTLTLGIDLLMNPNVDADSSIDAFLDDLSAALNTLRSQASSFGSHLSIVEIRTEFTKQMINTLQVGADNLVLADTNEEGANMLALQTRQQLSTTALSLASQADQAVLRLFG